MVAHLGVVAVQGATAERVEPGAMAATAMGQMLDQMELAAVVVVAAAGTAVTMEDSAGVLLFTELMPQNILVVPVEVVELHNPPTEKMVWRAVSSNTLPEQLRSAAGPADAARMRTLDKAAGEPSGL